MDAYFTYLCLVKIVSLVPSITEALFDLSSPPVVVAGRTKFCIHPRERVGEARIIGGTKNIRVDEIRRLAPDLIIANKEENVREQVEILRTAHKVWVTDVSTLADNAALLQDLGKMVGSEAIATEYIGRTAEAFRFPKSTGYPKIAYVIWQKPYMVAGGDTFISNVMGALGFANYFAEHRRYPEADEESLSRADAVFLSSEPYPFKLADVEYFKKLLGHGRVFLVDGEAFSWYGTHPAKCGAYYRSLYDEVVSRL